MRFPGVPVLLCGALVFALPLVAQVVPAQVPIPTADLAVKPVEREQVEARVELVGDSTQTDEAGYGRGFCGNLVAAVDCLNAAKGGASTRTYREQGLWARALAAEPDYMLIQFGHNDVQSSAHADRETDLKTEYPENLRRFVAEARAANIVPILVTPLARRYYGENGKIHDDLEAHAAAMRLVAMQENVALIDLHKLSVDALEGMTPEQADTLAITKKNAEGDTIADKTHLNWLGSYYFGRMVAVGLGVVRPELAGDVLPNPALLPEQGQQAMHVLEGGPVKIVLVGDSTVNAGGGWGKGFCAVLTPNVSCMNEALNGRSSKSYYDEGAWTKALADHGNYYLIQFGHNDMPGKGPERETDPATTYAANMKRYIDETRAHGGIPIIVTSLARRTYKDGVLVEDLKDYAEAARKVAESENVTVIDLNAMSTKLLQGMTQAEADEFDAEAHPDARKAADGKPAGPDRTHLNPVGQALFGRMVADELARKVAELGPDVKGQVGAGKQVVTAEPAGKKK